MKKSKERGTYNTAKITAGGTCPHCKVEIKPKCPTCGKKKLVKLSGTYPNGVTYFECKGCGKSCKGASV